MRIAQFINLFLFALVAGVLWGTWFSLSRSVAAITPGTFLEVGRTMIRNLAWPMRILLPASIVSALFVLFLLFGRERTGAFYLELSGLALFLVVLLVTLTVNVPIDSRIKQWTQATLPAE